MPAPSSIHSSEVFGLANEQSILNLESRRTSYHNALLAQIHDSARQAGAGGARRLQRGEHDGVRRAHRAGVGRQHHGGGGCDVPRQLRR